ncbi:hypothetical protein HUZ36_14395 [Pseudoalteromonas sp. McH1-7]|uniref:Uncharacterized protein n=1 Tax=Pseudoalteromonas peptidolytica F12-50-A1 TaxID=1315280 RepID=A0A8I0MXP5_9GAMM|nr:MULTISPECIES: hypothetical protein [Pseudoalteromonas]MBE0347932.1 hypothetical protein [Pseudoalteromonas peptidolytica F12-50-A1]NLR15274.1 hypothetical protein [Pseudoalteromonas peptidolytica]NUZ11975.1 hypothetical protein [Pseudoalteromonas sp. McH1-7]RXF01037.1 hypothetical protein D9603_14140 [Pseudoalteromonas sp. PS5]GEK11666.1 hypothetical protein PPE03_39150 [Pseudoalteromonas peptidolytica]
MADSYEVSSLLPDDTLRQILHGWGCPAFATPSNANVANTAQRQYFVHLFCGRIPTQSEVLHGTFIDRVGDSHRDMPLTLEQRYLGSFNVATAVGESVINKSVKSTGRIWPEQVSIASSYTALSPLPVASMATQSWMLDWSFKSTKTLVLSNGNLGWLSQEALSGGLNTTGATWFYISESENRPRWKTRVVQNPHSLDNTAVIESLHVDMQTSALPLIVGNVGAMGTNSDLELISGATGFNSHIRMAGLRIITT